MKEGIFDIRAEIRIAAASEEAARQVVREQHIAQHMCSWKKNPLGVGGHLYLGAELFLDLDSRRLTLQKPSFQPNPAPSAVQQSEAVDADSEETL